MNYKELEKFIRQLFQQYLNKFNLSVDDKNDAIQDTLLQLWRKEQDGTLEGDIEHNKNYIFITARNFVYQKSTNKQKSLDHYQINEEMDIPSKDKDIFDLTDIKYKKDLILSLMDNESFTDLERRIVDHIFMGYYIRDMVEIEKESYNTIKNVYANLKYKLKLRFEFIENPKYKFKVILNDGKEFKFIKQKEVAKFVKIPQTTFSYWKKKGRTVFKDFTLEYLN